MGLGAAALLVVCAAGCGSSPPATPLPSPTAGSATAPSAPVPSPALGAQRDTSGRSSLPCQAIVGPSALARSGFDARTAKVIPLSIGPPVCEWETPDSGLSVHLAAFEDLDILRHTYRTQNMWQRFTPVEIEGAPAVVQQVTPDSLSCTVTAGLGGPRGVEVTVDKQTRTTPAGPCEVATRFTATVIVGLPPRG